MEIGSNKKQSEGYDAFIPDRFPPEGYQIFSNKLIIKHSTAQHLLGKLDGITQLLPDVDFFLLMYTRKDAASSSQIEGTQATMINAIEAEAKLEKFLPGDVGDIFQYIKALNYGVKRLKKFPLSLRFLRELHKELMDGGRESHSSNPGNFRSSQNWIGGTTKTNATFVPPPPVEMMKGLEDFENFLHTSDDLLPLLKVGFIHAQFETIHPFLDGNGRTGRLLITFYLLLSKLLEKPVLFLSSYFRKHQNLYYERLNGYHSGKVEEWMEFLLDGIIETANQAIDTVKKITELRERDMEKIQKLSRKASESSIIVLPQLFALPIVDVRIIQEWTGFTRAGAQRVIDRFVDLGILKLRDAEKTYSRSYIYHDYVEIFSDD